jgi:hypothetical protein
VAGEYTIAGGLADARRLARQARVMEAATAAFLACAGLAAGTASLDVGRGDGQVTIAMARWAGRRGLAVGMDVDAGALAIARAGAPARGHGRQSHAHGGEKLFLAELVRNMRSAVLAAGAATGGELDALEAWVEAAARDPVTVFYQARIHQVWGRRTQ